jgi:protein TonB
LSPLRLIRPVWFFAPGRANPGAARGGPRASLSRCRFSLSRGIFVSALLHTLPLACWLSFDSSWWRGKPAAAQTEILQLDVFGLLSERQAEERRGEEPKPEPVPEPEPEPEPVPEPELPKMRETPRPPPARPRPTAARPLPAPPAAPPPPAREPEVEAQVRRTITQREREATLMRQYMTDLSRAVRSRLVYPVKARAKGWTGTVTLAFSVTETGNVLPGSESVRRSSGHAELDGAALNALRSASPLPPPPKQMEALISVDFREDP